MFDNILKNTFGKLEKHLRGFLFFVFSFFLKKHFKIFYIFLKYNFLLSFVSLLLSVSYLLSSSSFTFLL